MEFMTYYVNGTREEALSFLSDKLREKNYVKESYKQSLLEREEKHPTGLALADSVNIAIPHTDTEFANENVFVIGIPQNEIKFKRIDGPSVELSVDLIFLLVINDPDKYLKFLSKLTENFTNKEFLDYIKEKDLKKIESFLKKYVF
jgi:PTS system galactitol-specific IIA component